MALSDPLYTTLHDEVDMPLLPEWLWRGVNAAAVHSLFHTMNALDTMRHRSSERFEEVEIARDVSYGEPGSPWQRLDVWRPAAPSRALRPAMLFIHGGGFRTMSKRTHWFFARAFARMGFVVFSIDYHLGAQHPFPRPLQDAALALRYVVDRAEAHGADISRLVFAGESAGGNLALALTALCTMRRPEPWAQRVFDLGVVPRAVLPMCGVLQVSDPYRFTRTGFPRLVLGPMRDAEKSYHPQDQTSSSDLASPLLLLERAQETDRALPACMAPAGSLDPLADDARRLKLAMERLGASCEAPVYRRSAHSFMAFMWTANAQQCWDDMSRFISEQPGLLDEAPSPATALSESATPRRLSELRAA